MDPVQPNFNNPHTLGSFKKLYPSYTWTAPKYLDSTTRIAGYYPILKYNLDRSQIYIRLWLDRWTFGYPSFRDSRHLHEPVRMSEFPSGWEPVLIGNLIEPLSEKDIKSWISLNPDLELMTYESVIKSRVPYQSSLF